MDRIIALLEENNAMLKEVIAFLRYFKDNDDMRQFSINVAADIFVEMLEDNKELKNTLKNNFKSGPIRNGNSKI